LNETNNLSAKSKELFTFATCMKGKILLTVIGLHFLLVCAGQVSHGGKPLPLYALRSMNDQWICEMPSFDVDEQLRIDSLCDTDLRSGYRFAYKFMTNYNRSNSGMTFTLPDGTTVWRLGIRSQGALSLNVLFTEFELPVGGRLFLYNSDQTHILGAFNHLNNSELGILPVSPVYGEELVIEYQEPPGTLFSGKLTVGEVNHAYRYLRGREPGHNQDAFSCMDPVACFSADDPLIEESERSVVLIMINGDTACSGVMINNTSGNGKPYLLTASHCINRNFLITDPEQYAVMAGSIVCFFNYNSPICNPEFRGTEEMSVSSTKYLALNDSHDMALLELLEVPPIYYQPYYAGWDLSETQPSPFFAIHHPSGSVKRLNWFDGELSLATFKTIGASFSKDAHWFVNQWTSGCTHGGSSGSPLFNMRGKIVGALSGGFSSCSTPTRDYYYALSKAWEPEEEKDRQLKYWLDPTGKDYRSCDGLDPYKNNSPCERLSNVSMNGNRDEIEITEVSNTNPLPLFSNNALGADEFAEVYTVAKESKVYGAYIVTPFLGFNTKGLEVEICVYGGKNKPEKLLHKETFRPSFAHYEKLTGTFGDSLKLLDRAQESFVAFSKAVEVKDRFYIGYKIVSAPDDVYFTVYNIPKGRTLDNTTWLLYKNNWIEADAHPFSPMKTSLFIDPVIHDVNGSGSGTIRPGEDPVYISVGADRNTLYVVLPQGIESGRLSLIDMNGKIVKDYSVESRQANLPVPANLSGIYIAKLLYKQKQFIQKIIF